MWVSGIFVLIGSLISARVFRQINNDNCAPELIQEKTFELMWIIALISIAALIPSIIIFRVYPPTPSSYATA
jgi:phosphate/sulfate permease